MTRLAIVIDSTADLPTSIRDHPSIRRVSLRIDWDGRTYRDRVELDTATFYRRLRTTSSVPTTSSPPAAEFEGAYEDLLASHDAVISIHLGRELSGTWSTAQATATRIAPDRIRVVDSGQVSFPIGWLAAQALERAAAGAGLATIAEEIEARATMSRVVATLDTLEWLRRGGRIGRVAALAGTMLNLKPLLIIENGAVLPLERVRTRQAALRRLRDIVAELGPIERLGVLHGDAAESASGLVAELRMLHPDLTIDQAEISAVVGVHAGPGVVAIAYQLAGA